MSGCSLAIIGIALWIGGAVGNIPALIAIGVVLFLGGGLTALGESS